MKENIIFTLLMVTGVIMAIGITIKSIAIIASVIPFLLLFSFFTGFIFGEAK
jgi:hypothetical protein